MNKDKDITGSSKRQQTYKSAITDRNEKILKEEALKAIPDDEKLCEDAYKLAQNPNSPKEYIFPYIPITTIWISPIEEKYINLSPEEVINFYLRCFTDPYIFPKDFTYYQAILSYTGSVQFGSTSRSGEELAYSKATIKRILLPEQWDGDLYKTKEMIPDSRNAIRRVYFNYFDYIKAWDVAFCYENRQRKHSWFIQIKIENGIKIPQWFMKWFSEWGLYPIILPKKIRKIYDEFVNINPSMKYHCLLFCILYQVPWIFKWDVIVTPRSIEKFGVTVKIPYLGRRNIIKWWDKFNFFEESIFSARGMICLETKPVKQEESKRSMPEILKELMKGSSKKELKAQLQALLESSSSNEEDYQPMSQDSQDPEYYMQESQVPLKGYDF